MSLVFVDKDGKLEKPNAKYLTKTIYGLKPRSKR